MRKFILSLSLAVAIIFAGQINAQTLDQKSKATTTPKTEVKPIDQNQVKQQNPELKHAQKPLTTEEKAKKSVDKIASKVKDLSPDQIKKLTELHTTTYAEYNKIREANKDNPEKAQEAMKANMQKLNAGIKNTLTPEQFTVYSAANQAKIDAKATKTIDPKAAPAKEKAPPKDEKKK